MGFHYILNPPRINDQYIDIYHTKKQAENTLSSCSFPFLKHCLISYRSVMYFRTIS